ncbi:MAG: 1-aminocyclopropane-1-carboxylate deaminase/D-cysteine desulfhydrase [Saprospirales bacterium]|nr:1-aminocyclopropane-1-carboxylate deaminase/D-cysteine desulfhydrase [Saprospirales bacterium]MBK8489647.1 1-aminocyclopropane-1-carboxylate deaminase/D-cysteine desulfhydrase [Saprospirales bacterium]
MLPTPIDEWPLHSEVRILVKRDDQTHPHVSGNKWRKLKYNLEAARNAGKTGLLTFGGAFSNHLSATAAAGQLLGWKTLGFVRGERHLPLNPTLSFAHSCGMEIRYLDRTTYRARCKGKDLENWESDFWILPEGGSNTLALNGCAELATECFDQLSQWPDYVCVAAGTGATAAGLVTGLPEQTQLLAFPVLKGDFMGQEIQNFLDQAGQSGRKNWQAIPDYHFGGYAKFNSDLIDFINQTKTLYGIPLDPVYTGKLFFGVADLLKKGFFPAGSTVLVIHTGGLQGIAGFKERFANLLT